MSSKKYLALDYDGTMIKAVPDSEGGYNGKCFFGAASDFVQIYETGGRKLEEKEFNYICKLTTGSTDLNLVSMLLAFCSLRSSDNISDIESFTKAIRSVSYRRNGIEEYGEIFWKLRRKRIKEERYIARELGLAFPEDRILDGTIEFLERAAHAGYELWIVTGNSEMEERINPELRKYFTSKEGSLRCVCGLESSTRAGLLNVLKERLKEEGNEVFDFIYFGDSPMDRESAFDISIGSRLGIDAQFLSQQEREYLEQTTRTIGFEYGNLVAPVVIVGHDEKNLVGDESKVVLEVPGLDDVTIEDLELVSERFKILEEEWHYSKRPSEYYLR
jgi:phosphoglycolate phosphatase-like HAD superfamily hydrolase